MSFISRNILNYRGICEIAILLALLLVISCDSDDPVMEDQNGIVGEVVAKVDLPKRPGPVPNTTTGVPHIQIGVKPVPEVNDELFRRVYSLPGIENRKSVIAAWRGLWINEEVSIAFPEALIDDREFAHIHDDGSLHIFLEPFRAEQAIEACWAVHHPFAVQGLEGWDGFVMLYTPQSLDELDITFQLIVDGYNYVTAQSLVSTDYY